MLVRGSTDACSLSRSSTSTPTTSSTPTWTSTSRTMFPFGDALTPDSLSWFLNDSLDSCPSGVGGDHDQHAGPRQPLQEGVSSTQLIGHECVVNKRRVRRSKRDASDMGRKRKLGPQLDDVVSSKMEAVPVSCVSSSSSMEPLTHLKLESVEEDEESTATTIIPTTTSASIKTTSLSDSSKARFLRANHSEIEKRRRDKMNTYISELASIIPSCSAMARKMDKLTVLRLALQYLRSIKGAASGSMTEIAVRPHQLSEMHLTQLMEKVTEGFLFIIDLARGRLLHVAENVSESLSFTRNELLGRPLFDLLHPKDIGHVKEQLPDGRMDEPKERLVDAKTGLTLKTNDSLGLNANLITAMSPGARRAFLCRMRIKVKDELFSEEGSTHSSISGSGSVGKRSVSRSQRKYALMQCVGYIKTWPSSHVTGDADREEESNTELGEPETEIPCLVAIARPIISPSTSLAMSVKEGLETVRGCDFDCRLSAAAKFVFLDDRSAAILGYMPRELLGSCIYSHVHSEDVGSLSDTLTKAKDENGKFESQVFRFRNKNHSYVCLKVTAKQFVNPWTQETDFLSCRLTMCVPIHLRDPTKHFEGSIDSSSLSHEVSLSSSISGRGMDIRMSGSTASVSSVALQQTSSKAHSGAQLLTDVASTGGSSLVTSKPEKRPMSASSSASVNRNTLLPSLFKDERRSRVGLAPRAMDSSSHSSSPQSATFMAGMKQESLRQPSTTEAANGSNTNSNMVNGMSGLVEGDEASMSLIMSLLEVDGGLGADLGSTWPLP